MEKKRFRVRLVRPVFQYVDVEVEAGEEYEAVSTALEGAGTIPDDEWRGNFDPEEYGVDAVHVTEAAGVDEEMFTSIAEEANPVGVTQLVISSSSRSHKKRGTYKTSCRCLFCAVVNCRNHLFRHCGS